MVMDGLGCIFYLFSALENKGSSSTKRRLKRLKGFWLIAFSIQGDVLCHLGRICIQFWMVEIFREFAWPLASQIENGGCILSPCCTPVSYGRFLSADLSFSWMWQFLYNFLITSIREIGRPYFFRISKKMSCWMESKAFTRSTKRM